jgi:hypothetical protein
MEVDTPREPMFRPVKRRKFLRKRPDSGDSDEPMQGSEIAPSTTLQKPNRDEDKRDESLRGKEDNRSMSAQEEDTGVTFAEIMRLRKPYRGRKAGIEFSTDSSKSRSRMGGGDDDPASPGALISQDSEAERLRAISNRFTPHSGQKVDVDKHMYVSVSHTPPIYSTIFWAIISNVPPCSGWERKGSLEASDRD